MEASKLKGIKQKGLIPGGALGLGWFGFFGTQLLNSDKARSKNMALAKELLMGQEKRNYKNLYDGILHSLSILEKQVETTQNAVLNNWHMLQKAREEVWSLSLDLHSIKIRKLGITNGVHDMLAKFARNTDIIINEELDNIDELFSNQANLIIYRTIQEALGNIIEHADVTAVDVVIKRNQDLVNIIVQHNGKGMDGYIEDVKPESAYYQTMAERILSIGGKLEIKTGSQGGMMIEWQLPLFH